MEWLTEVWTHVKALMAFWTAVTLLLIPLVLFIRWQLKAILRTIAREIGIGAVYAAQSIIQGVGDAAFDTVKSAASGIVGTAGDVASGIAGAASDVASGVAETTTDVASEIAETASDSVEAVESFASKARNRVKNFFKRNPKQSTADTPGSESED